MATAARATKHLIAAYKAVRRAEEQTQAKLDALLTTTPLYSMFEPDKNHPYFDLATSAVNALDVIERLIAGVSAWSIDGITIEYEIDLVKVLQMQNGEVDNDIDAMRLIAPAVMTEAEAAERLMLLYQFASRAWSWSGSTMINNELARLHGRKNIPQHKEIPEIAANKECRSAMREVKKLVKELLDYGNGMSTIREELQQKKLMYALAGKNTNGLIDLLLNA